MEFKGDSVAFRKPACGGLNLDLYLSDKHYFGHGDVIHEIRGKVEKPQGGIAGRQVRPVPKHEGLRVPVVSKIMPQMRHRMRSLVRTLGNNGIHFWAPIFGHTRLVSGTLAGWPLPTIFQLL